MKMITRVCLIVCCSFVLFSCEQVSTVDDDISSSEFQAQALDYDMVVLGDNQPSVKNLVHYVGMANAMLPRFFVHVGDRVQYSTPLTYLSLMQVLSELDSDIELIPVVGNHDLEHAKAEPDMKLYNHFFGNAPEFEGYWSVPLDDQYLIILNSYIPGEGNNITNSQFEWLRSELEIAGDRDIFVFLHHPVFPAGHHSPIHNRDRFHDLMADYQVKAVFSGHEHLFYQQIEDGVKYYITGGAGSKLHVDAPRGRKLFHMLGVRFSPFRVDLIHATGEFESL